MKDIKNYIVKNRQSYKYNKNGNLVFDEERGKRPNDLPKNFYNVK